MTDQGRISYSRECEIWRAAGRKGKHRFTAVELVCDRLIATDDRMLASIPVDGAVGESSYTPIDPEALKEARKATRVGQKAVLEFGDGDAGPPSGVRYPLVFDSQRHVPLPPIEEAMPEGVPIGRIGLDPKRLLELAKAIGADNGIMLELYVEGAIVVRKVDKEGRLCCDPDDAFGLLFPVTPTS